MRLAARPVGAASSNLTPFAASTRSTVSSSVVLPTPGPPVITLTLAASTRATAAHCEGDSALPVRASVQASARLTSIPGQGGSPRASASSRSAMSRSTATLFAEGRAERLAGTLALTPETLWAWGHLTTPGSLWRTMAEQTGLESKTVHRLLEVDPKNGGFRKGADDPLDRDLLVVDESSMLDVPLMNALTKAVPPRAGLLLVGDVDQLPSAGPGRVLADVIESGAVAVAWLTEVFRQAQGSRIVTNAHRINRGEMPEWPRASEGRSGEMSDFYAVESPTRRTGRPR